jgi:predicted nuclease with TOPRIM domain
VSTSIQEKFHRQHRRWRDDHAAWRADLDAWRRELRAALDALAEVEGMLRDALEALAAHADAVWESGERVRAHELTLCQEARTGERYKTDRQWAALHHREAARHERLADAHARIKRHHRIVVAEVMKLLNRARAAM